MSNTETAFQDAAEPSTVLRGVGSSEVELNAAQNGNPQGEAAATVFLVGAGPGDPGLLTLRARDLLAKADEVIYDYLASDAVMRFAADSAKKIFVGKKGFSQHVTQDEINDLLIFEAQAQPGKLIVRLKGGDPFVFGRGGEEALALTSNGIAFEVVPGITAGVAACAYAGIPVTHRGLASAVTLITGHETPDKPESAINWAAFAQNAGTLCFYMGVRDLPHIVERLIHFGRPENTPVALVRWGTTPKQEVLSATLGDVVEKVEKAQFKAPAIIVVGDAVTLRDSLAWFDAKPLFGKTIVVTRSREQASALSSRLEALGAETVEFPVIKPVARPVDGDIAHAIDTLSGYDWVVFTSANGVSSFFAQLESQGKDARAFGGAKVCAIGPATAAALKGHGIVADIVPPRFVAESVAETLEGCDVGSGSRVLVLRAAVAREALIETLREAGADVDVVAVYDTVKPQADEQVSLLKQRLEAGEIDAVTFTSSSTVRNFCDLIGDAVGKERFRDLMSGVACLSIGPVTSRTIVGEGLSVSVEAEEFTIPGLVTATQAYFCG